MGKAVFQFFLKVGFILDRSYYFSLRFLIYKCVGYLRSPRLLPGEIVNDYMITTKFSTKTLFFHLWVSCTFPFSNSHCCFSHTFPQIANPPGILIIQYSQNTLASLFLTVAHKSDAYWYPWILTTISGIVPVPQKLNLFTLWWSTVLLPPMGYLVCPIHVIGKPLMTLQLTSKHPAQISSNIPNVSYIPINHSAWDSTYICWFTNLALY